MGRACSPQSADCIRYPARWAGLVWERAVGPEAHHCWHVRLGVRFGAQPPNEGTFHCEVVFEGLFAVHPDIPPEKTNDLVRMNGGAILYGAAREMILNLTARSKHGPFELPTIDARMFLKKPEETGTKATKASRQKE